MVVIDMCCFEMLLTAPLSVVVNGLFTATFYTSYFMQIFLSSKMLLFCIVQAQERFLHQVIHVPLSVSGFAKSLTVSQHTFVMSVSMSWCLPIVYCSTYLTGKKTLKRKRQMGELVEKINEGYSPGVFDTATPLRLGKVCDNLNSVYIFILQGCVY